MLIKIEDLGILGVKILFDITLEIIKKKKKNYKNIVFNIFVFQDTILVIIDNILTSYNNMLVNNVFFKYKIISSRMIS